MLSTHEAHELDRWITGECDYDKRPVTATCANGHEWPTVQVTDMGASELRDPDCPECGEPAQDADTEEGAE